MYKKYISLKTIRLTFTRRLKCLLLCFFLPFSIASIIVLTFVENSYLTQTIISKPTAFTPSQFQLFQERINDKSVYEKTFLELESSELRHSNGDIVALNEIISGISYSNFVSGSPTVTIFFETSDSVIAQRVLREFAIILVNSLANNDKSSNHFSLLDISLSPTKPTRADTKDRMFLIILLGSLVFSFVISFWKEVVSDEVFDKFDVIEFGCKAIELDISKERLNK